MPSNTSGNFFYFRFSCSLLSLFYRHNFKSIVIILRVLIIRKNTYETRTYIYVCLVRSEEVLQDLLISFFLHPHLINFWPEFLFSPNFHILLSPLTGIRHPRCWILKTRPSIYVNLGFIAGHSDKCFTIALFTKENKKLKGIHTYV